MSVENTFSELRGSEGTMRAACPLHGCRRVYPDRSALDAHIAEHDSPAQSVPGKVLLCSTAGCSGSFPNMKKLMEHMRQHHKPNIYFLCESCRTKLRSYRGLLTHLHTCSKVPRGKAKVADAAPPLASSSPNPTAGATSQNPPALDSTSQTQAPGSASSVSQPNYAAAPPHVPTVLDLQPEQQELQKTPPDVPPPAGSGAATDPPDGPLQTQGPSRGPALAPKSPSGSSAVWKKTQGSSLSGKVLWEHSKGRYVCVQCGHLASNRAQMTQHASTHGRAAEDAGNPAPNAS
ncbi:zinc finger protein 414 isoform X1 [Takifugu flavidus]|uniref:zinc finger protein 414 isoform X1 n=1 Tax=Takifugu flavidus TaxID=433684 RepID=UPI0025449E24|nr:zinc finger protein 414 isoform X1 [Takifugu flavidus]